jgi:hypothetical protein
MPASNDITPTPPMVNISRNRRPILSAYRPKMAEPMGRAAMVME